MDVTGRATVGQREQRDKLNAALDQIISATQQAFGNSAFIQIGNQNQDGIGRILDQTLAIGHRAIDVGTAG